MITIFHVYEILQFLSMRLTAASACYDFNSDSDDMGTMQVLKLIS